MLPESFTPEFLRQLELLKLHSRRAFLGSRQGGHLSLKRGHGIEFSDYRKYELGDNPREIDWGVYARSDRLYVKRFQEEQDLSVLLVLDPSASMATPQEDGKWERAVEIALVLAYVALMDQDGVLLSVLGRLHSPLYAGPRAIHQIAKVVSGIEPGGQPDFERETQRAAARIRFPGLAVVISDFLMPFEQLQMIFNILRAKNLDITAVQVLGSRDLDPIDASSATFVDSETGEELALSLDAGLREQYRSLVERHNQQLQEFLLESRVSFANAHTKQDLSEFLIEGLAATGLLRQ